MSLLSRLAVTAARAYGILSSNSKNVNASYLVVAGGGGAGSNAATYNGGTGGGGAGGFLNSTFTLSILNTYTITVGAGGAAGASSTVGSNGANSIILGTGLTTVTSVGGGGGGKSGPAPSGSVSPGSSGGSGGGGGGTGTFTNTGGSATSGQGNAGGTATQAGANYGGAGGGGAGAVGGSTTNSNSGANGGVGSASSISGSSVTYAGGGGGGGYSPGTAGTGGSGGGGNGSNSTNGTAGTANLGGGGGGAGSAPAGALGGAGGSGVVIISYTSATPKFVGGTLTTSGGNQIHTFTSSGSLSPLTPVTASYLVVAGGGSGGANAGGGGGAGGLLTSSTTIYSGATYVVTVGAGGAGVTGGGAPYPVGISGSNSSLAGTGLTTVTSTGGGGGGSYANSTARNGLSGGSGGGAGNFGGTTDGTAGTGTSGQGSNGGASFASNFNGGGGGGASAVGGNATSPVAGTGGAGTASSITGSSVTYAGGGGGGGGNTTSVASGGAGGGGAGGSTSPTSAGTAGTANTGGGGGGSSSGSSGSGSGGSGTVIISYAGSQVFNGGLVTSSGGNTIHTFNATGALTPLTNNLNNSLRFRSSASAYLSRTFASSGTNNKIQTFSAWVKRGLLSSSTDYRLMGGYDGSSANSTEINFNNDSLRLEFGGAANNPVITTQVFRDPSAWYHIVVAIDTTQATAANRVKMYVNGNQVTAFSTATYPAQNALSQLTSANVNNRIGSSWSGSNPFDGYMTDINFIDGQALEPYYFGNNDAYGNWKPIKYTGMYGTNGFYLNFADTSALTTSSNAGLGKDTSGNGNYWATNNISITAGVTYDAMTDVPTNTSATVANYCVLNPLNAASNQAISFANLRVIESAGTAATRAYSTFELPSSKIYFEVTMTTASSTNMMGVGTSGNLSNYPGQDANSWAYHSAGILYNNSNTTLVTAASTAGDIVGVAVDMSAGKIWFSVNNTYVASGNPSAGTNPAFSGLTGSLFPIVRAYTSTMDINFGQRPFSYTPPTGFVALNTYNLPTPTILQGNLYMDATLYTQNGAATNVVVNAGQFKPDLVWLKCRSNAGTYNVLTDTVRGIANSLYSNTTTVENSDGYNFFNSFNSNGFSLTLGDSGTNSTSGRTQVGWQWQAGQGSTSSNTSGSITSTVSVNTTAGFSVVTYTSQASGTATFGHGLGVAPSMIFLKGRNLVGGWYVYHSALGGTKYLALQSTGAATTAADGWNNTNPTSTVVSVGNGYAGSYNMVAYCWAEIAGFSKFGSYTGNGSTDGPFVYTGFRPKWIMIKNTTTVGQAWFIYDSARSTYNLVTAFLQPNTSNAEAGSSVDNPIDILSNGFKIRYTNTGTNTSSDVYIFAAYAENPFKNANAR